MSWLSKASLNMSQYHLPKSVISRREVGLYVVAVVTLINSVDRRMSIWDCADFQDEEGYPSIHHVIYRGIDDLLDREDVKLEDVLKSEDLIQEVNGLNDNLIGYLKKPEIAKALFK